MDVSDVAEIDQAQAIEIHRNSAFARGYAFGAGKFAIFGALIGGVNGAQAGELTGFILGVLIGAVTFGAVGWVLGQLVGSLSRFLAGSDPVGACQITYTNEQSCQVTFTLCGPLPIVIELIQSFQTAQRASPYESKSQINGNEQCNESPECGDKGKGRLMNQENKTKATADIYYEAWMLHQAYSEYWQSELRAKTPWQRNSILEATLLHTRALLDFFQRSRTGRNPAQDDDVLAEDYDFPTTPFSFSSELSKRINKRIIHLTYARGEVRHDDRHWDFPSFVPPILDRCREFFTHLLDTGRPMADWPGETELRTLIRELNRESA